MPSSSPSPRDDEDLSPHDRERLQLQLLDRWFAKRPIDRGSALYWAKERARREIAAEALGKPSNGA